MSASDTRNALDCFPFAPLSAPASIYPAAPPPMEPSEGRASLATYGGSLPWGFDRLEPSQDELA